MSEEQKVNPYYQTPHQRSLARWLSKAEFNVFATLTFRSDIGITLRGAERAYGKFAKSMADHFGEAGLSEPVAVPVVENSYEQLSRRGMTCLGREATHVHVLMKLPGSTEKNREVVRRLWLRASKRICGDPKIYCPDSDEWFKSISTQDERDIYIKYMTKYMQDDCTGLLVDHINFGSSEPPREKGRRHASLDFSMFENVVSYEEGDVT